MSDADAQTGWNPARGGHPEVLLRLKHLTPHPDRNATTHRQNRLAASDGIHLLSAGCATRSINRPPLVITRSPGASPLSTSTVLPLASPTLIRCSSIAFSLSLSRTTQTRAASPS